MHATADLARADDALRARCRHPNGAFAEFPRADVERSICDRFDAQVRRHRDRLALRTRDARLTYDQLDRAANRVAHAVLERAGGRTDPVALLLDSGAAFSVASLGVLKTGAPQVPLDRAFPRARLAYMLEQSGASLVLCTDRSVALAREIAGPDRAVLSLDAIESARMSTDPSQPVGPDAVAAIEYTSGSTGQPKGIVRTHRGSLHDVLRHTSMSRLCPSDRMVLPGQGLLHPLHGLLNGAAYIAVERRPEAIAGIADWLIAERVTIFRTAVSLFRAFAGSLTGAERFSDLRLIELYGEPVFERDVELVRRHFAPECLLVSTLGTSEFGDFCHCFVDRERSLPGGVVPAGYPAQDVDLLLLDDDGRPAPAGEPGEIAIRGRYGAAGYWQRPDLTAAQFGPVDAGGHRVYRTGDVGRLAADGCLHHLGRRDFQVKVNGNRVHVSEVEAALLAHGSIRATAVVGVDAPEGGARLVAYVVPAAHPRPTVSSLRDAVASRLPAFMVPSAFVFLDMLPRTDTGKIDRRGLPAPDGLRPDLDAPYVAPATPLENRLAALWAELLGLDRVGVDDDFFELGGDSLLAAKLAARVLEALSLALPLHALLAAGTVRAMAGAALVGLAAGADDRHLAAALDAVRAPADRGGHPPRDTEETGT